MIVVLCSGFPVPASRYFREFRGVELSDTELGIPGDGTVRRWVREAGAGFVFSALAPKEIGASGFRRTNENAAHVAAIAGLAEKLHPKAIVFGVPKAFEPSKANRAAVKAFLGTLPAAFPTPVLDFPAWPTAAVEQASGGRAVAAWDPLDAEPARHGDLAYLVLPGPAGPRSRYDADAITRIAARSQALNAHLVLCVFRNQDMHTNATALRDGLKKLSSAPSGRARKSRT
jgi:uncharacterized protein YecE (DUF72 family)